jgi:membrane-associated phospholipid phosphatase
MLASGLWWARRHWFSLLIGGALLAFIGIHVVWYTHPSDIKTVEELQARLNNGQPVVVEYYSNL